MKTTLMILLSAFTAGAQSAIAGEPSWYGSLNLGVALPEGDLMHKGANVTGMPDYNLDNGGVVGIGAGYAFGNGFRLEGELRGRGFEADGRAWGSGARFGELFDADGTVTSTTLMSNLAYDFVLTQSKLRPYLKGGLGVAWNRAEADFHVSPTFEDMGMFGRWDFPDGKDAQFAWSVGAGATYPLNDRLSMTAEYQYIDLGSAETDTDIYGDRMRFDDLGSHEITLGMRYAF